MRPGLSNKPRLEESVTGVFVGIQAFEFSSLLALLPAGTSVYAGTGVVHAAACGRMSFALGMQGPCVSCDTACSAGLVAVHATSSALALGECASGVAVSINLMLMPASCVAAAVGGMTSALGRCHTFDSRADGYARAEACSASVLCVRGDEDQSVQPPPWAEYVASHAARLSGSAVRQDGRSASLTAPNGQAQQWLLLAARARTGSEASLSCSEAHGTGTALGDPIETGSYAYRTQQWRRWCHGTVPRGSLRVT